jgi:hypothetical protein
MLARQAQLPRAKTHGRELVEVPSPQSREALQALGERLLFLRGQVREPVERREPPIVALRHDQARARNPVGLLPVDEVADDVERAPALRALVRTRPGIRQTREERAQDRGCALEDRRAV